MLTYPSKCLAFAPGDSPILDGVMVLNDLIMDCVNTLALGHKEVERECDLSCIMVLQTSQTIRAGVEMFDGYRCFKGDNKPYSSYADLCNL